MSRCKHNIIARSGRSHWVAWLKRDRDQVVSAPRSRRADRKFDQASALLLPGWVRV